MQLVDIGVELLTTDSTSLFSFSAHTIIRGKERGIIKQHELNTFPLVKKQVLGKQFWNL